MSHLQLASLNGKAIKKRTVPHPDYIITFDMHDLRRMKESYDWDLNHALWIHMDEANKTVPGSLCIVSNLWRCSIRAPIIIAICRTRGVVLMKEDGSLFMEDKERLSAWAKEEDQDGKPVFRYNRQAMSRLPEANWQRVQPHRVPEQEDADGTDS